MSNPIEKGLILKMIHIKEQKWNLRHQRYKIIRSN